MTIDLLRVAAMTGVVVGHWLVTALVATPSGLATTSPLRHLTELTPLTWVLQTLALFFFAGGYAAARSHRAGTHPTWLARRITGFARGVLPLGLFWLTALAALALFGTPPQTLTVLATLVIGPLWFLAVYIVLLATLPLIERAHRRFGLRATLLPLAVVGLHDALRYGPWDSPLAADWLGWVSIVAGWLIPFQLGYALASGRLRHQVTGPVLLIAGVAAAAFLVQAAGYPASMVGVTGTERSNLSPPSLATIALGLAQIGLYCLLRDRLGRMLTHRRPAAIVRASNALTLPIYLWHQSALLLVVLLAARTPLTAGLIGAPDSLTWLAQRILWLPVFAVALAGAVKLGQLTRPEGQPIPGAPAARWAATVRRRAGSVRG